MDQEAAVVQRGRGVSGTRLEREGSQALVGFQGRGMCRGRTTQVLSLFLLETRLCPGPYQGVVLLGQGLEHKPPEAKKSDS
jgi:hypothetical protein